MTIESTMSARGNHMSELPNGPPSSAVFVPEGSRYPQVPIHNKKDPTSTLTNEMIFLVYDFESTLSVFIRGYTFIFLILSLFRSITPNPCSAPSRTYPKSFPCMPKSVAP